jgi:hypothetical protein
MHPEPLPTLSELNARLEYDCLTGNLTWKPRSHATEPFARAAEIVRWNKRFAGRTAGTLARNGYTVLCIRDRQYKAHRVCYAIGAGADTASLRHIYIDHVNGDRSDNRIANLRAATTGDNNRNARLSARNKSGVVGVAIKRNGFEASISYNNVRYFIGRFSTVDDAAKARKDFEKKLGYHPNHGRAPT